MTTSRSSDLPRFTSRTPKSEKRGQGRTRASQTPLHIRSARVSLTPKVRSAVEERVGRGLGKIATHIERISLRFEDVNGPRGGHGIQCRMKVVLSGLPSVHAQAHGRTPHEAFQKVAPAIEDGAREAIRRAEGRLASRAQREPAGNGRGNGTASRPSRAAGRGAGVDTALEGVSASDKKVGDGATAQRNLKARRKGMTAALEDSATGQPSRKSTRKAVNRAKAATGLERRARGKVASSKARAKQSAAART